MQELSEFVVLRVDTWLRTQATMSKSENTFLISFFRSESVFFQREVVVELYARAHGGSTQGLSRGNITEIIRFITEGSNSYGIKEVKKLRLERRGERVYYS